MTQACGSQRPVSRVERSGESQEGGGCRGGGWRGVSLRNKARHGPGEQARKRMGTRVVMQARESAEMRHPSSCAALEGEAVVGQLKPVGSGKGKQVKVALGDEAVGTLTLGEPEGAYLIWWLAGGGSSGSTSASNPRRAVPGNAIIKNN